MPSRVAPAPTALKMAFVGIDCINKAKKMRFNQYLSREYRSSRKSLENKRLEESAIRSLDNDVTAEDVRWRGNGFKGCIQYMRYPGPAKLRPDKIEYEMQLPVFVHDEKPNGIARSRNLSTLQRMRPGTVDIRDAWRQCTPFATSFNASSVHGVSHDVSNSSRFLSRVLTDMH